MRENAAAPAGLLLAAGAGRRLGIPKALVKLGGRTLTEAGVDLLRYAGCVPVGAVIGAEAAAVRAAVTIDDVEWIIAKRWSEGQSHSLRAGLRWARSVGVPAVVVALVDQPFVTSSVVKRLSDSWRSGAVVAAATYDGRRRTPVLFDASVWAAVEESLDGDRGAGPWLHAHPDLVTDVEVGDIAAADDIDTADDLRRACVRSTPTDEE